MADVLDEILAEPPSTERQIVPDVCLDQKRRATLQRLIAERDAISVSLDAKRGQWALAREEVRAASAPEEGERTGPPRKSGQRGVIAPLEAKVEELKAAIDAEQARLDAKAAELETERDAMRARTGDLEIYAPDAGEWQRWKDANPPREGNLTDAEIGSGFCNATALIADLPKYIFAWGGREIPEEKRAAFVERLAYSDRAVVASSVVMMFETRVSIPKSSSASSSTEPSATD